MRAWQGERGWRVAVGMAAWATLCGWSPVAVHGMAESSIMGGPLAWLVPGPRLGSLGPARAGGMGRLLQEGNEAHRVVGLPGAEGIPAESMPTMFAGTVPNTRAGVAEAEGGELFYWLVCGDTAGTRGAGGAADASTGCVDSDDTDLVIWLNGGPGCSSMDGMMIENGPFAVVAGSPPTLEVRETSWHKVAHVLYVDQPAGTGLSPVADYDGNEGEVDAHFEAFLHNWLDLYPGMADKAIFLAGESYAGTYLPWIAQTIMEGNAAGGEGRAGRTLNVQGMMLGNPWSDPVTQTGLYPAFAHGQGLISLAQRRALEARMGDCKHGVEEAQSMCVKCSRLANPTAHTVECAACLAGSSVCNAVFEDLLQATGKYGQSVINIYDVREMRPYFGSREWPPGMDTVGAYLGQQTVRDALHVPAASKKWTECDGPVYEHLVWDQFVGSMSAYRYVLDAGIKVLVFNGNFDLICNHLGNEAMLDALVWSGGDAFRDASRFAWLRNCGTRCESAGFAREASGLSFLVVHGGSHMVPLDVGDVALDMLKLFISTPFGESMFEVKEQALEQSPLAAKQAGEPWVNVCVDFAPDPDSYCSGKEGLKAVSSVLMVFMSLVIGGALALGIQFAIHAREKHAEATRLAEQELYSVVSTGGPSGGRDVAYNDDDGI